MFSSSFLRCRSMASRTGRGWLASTNVVRFTYRGSSSNSGPRAPSERGGGLAVVTVIAGYLSRREIPARGRQRGGPGHSAAGEQPPPRHA